VQRQLSYCELVPSDLQTVIVGLQVCNPTALVVTHKSEKCFPRFKFGFRKVGCDVSSVRWDR